MRFRIVLFTLLVFAVCLSAIAEDFDGILINTKQNKWASSNYFAKGVEAINDDDIYTALDMFGMEVKQHPSNGYAICNLAQCQFTVARHDMYVDIYSDDRSNQEKEVAREKGFKGMRSALPLFDKGLSLLPTNDGEALCQAYRVKASMLLKLDDIDSTLVAECYDKAIAAHPCEDVYGEHINFFSENTEIVTADAQELRKLYPDNPMNVKLLTIMAYRNEDYSQCLALCEEYDAMLKSQGEDGIDSQVEAIHIMALKELGREDEAMDLCLKYIEDYELNEAAQIYMMLAEKEPELAEIKIKQRMFTESGNNILWNTMLGRIMEVKKDYSSALEYFKAVEKTDKEAFIFNEIANCYYMLGDIDNALLYIDAATIMDEGNEYFITRDKMLINSGMAGKLIGEKMTGLEVHKIINEDEFIQRMILAELLVDDHDYALAESILKPLIEMDDGASALSLYATALKGLGRDDEAQRCLRQITEIDPLPFSDTSELIAALHDLGRDEEAMEKADRLAQKWENRQLHSQSDEEIPSCYTLATVYAQLGVTDKALEYLEKHFIHDNMPYNFGIMERDWRLDNVRELPQYKTLVEKYKTIWKSNATTIK